MRWRGLIVVLLTVAPILHGCQADSPVELEIPDPDEAARSIQEGPAIIPDEYIVVFQDNVADPGALAAALGQAHGLQRRHVYRSAIKGFSARIPAQAVDALRRNPNVRYIEQNAFYQLDGGPAGGGTLLSPLPAPFIAPTLGLQAHLVASDLAATLMDGDAVGVWPNRGTATDAVQFDASKLPTYHAGGSGFGGQAHVGFNEGTDNDEVMEITGATGHASATLIAVYRQDDADRHNYGLFAPWGSASSRASFLTYRSSGKRLSYWDTDDGWSNSSMTVGAGQDRIVMWRVDESEGVEFSVDGAPAGSASMSGGMPAFDRYVVGASEPNTVSRFDGQVAELLFYDRALLACEADPIVADLGGRYGISVSVTSAPCDPPTAPSGLVASAVDYRQIDLTWADGSDNEDGFRIERREGQTGSWTQVAEVAMNTTSYSDVPLLAETEYCYRVSAYNADGTSGPTGVGCATTTSATPPPPPPPPVTVPTAGLRVRLVGNDLVGTLADGSDMSVWPNRGSEADAAQADAARLPAFHGGGTAFGGHAYIGFNEGTDNDEVMEVPGVAAHGSGTLIAVFSKEASANHNEGLFAPWGSASSRASFLPHRSPDALISYWDATHDWSVSQTSVEEDTEHVVVWRVDGSLSVDFQVDGAPAGSVSMSGGMPAFDRYVVGASEPNTVSRFDGQVAELLFYDRALLACEADPIVADLGGRYGISVSVTSAPCDPPTAPSGLVASAVDYRQIDLTWADGSDNEDGFRIERREGQTGSWTQVAEVAMNTTSYSDVPLLAETEYCYRVSAYNADGTSGPTGVGCATTTSATPPPPPPPPVTVPTAGLRVRLVGNDLVGTLADGSDMSVWPNRGSEADAAQADAARLPAFHGGGTAFGGHAYIGFNEGTDNDEVMEITGATGHASATLIAVYRQDDADRHNYGLFAPWGSASSRASFLTYRSSGKRLSYWDTDDGWSNSSMTVGAGQDRIVMWRVDESEGVEFSVDGAPAGSASMSGGMPAFDRYVVGASEPNTVSRFDGQVAELLFYDRALLACEADPIVADLGGRYGISVSVTSAPCDPPTAPSGLVASAVDYRQIDLTWADGSDNEDGFRIERREGQTGSWTQVAEVAMNTTSYSDVPLLAETEYCYRVSAYNADGTSGPTGVGCATTTSATPPPPPPPPVTVPTAGLRVRLVGNDLVGTLADGSDMSVWPNRGSEADAAQADAARLPAFHGGGTAFGGHAYIGFNEGTDNDEVMEVPGVAAHGSGTLIAVFSKEASANHNEGLFAPWGSASSRASFLPHRSPDALISYWDATHDWSVSQTSVEEDTEHVVVWRVDGSLSVDFQVDGAPAGSVSMSGGMPAFDRYVVGASEPNTVSRFDGQVAELLFYDRALLACEADPIVADLGGRYGISVSVTSAPCDPPTAPSGLVASAVDYRQIDLTWADGSDNEDGFRIERREGQTGSWTQVAEVAMNTTSYSDVPLLAETEYCYRVSAYNADGTSGPTGVGCATTTSATPPPPPPPPVTVPTAGLRVRLVGNDLVGTLADGSDMSVWPNRGSEADAAQADAARLPAFHGGGTAFGGHAYIGFNEGTDNDEVMEVPGVAAHGSGTLIAVFSKEASANHNEGLFAPWGSASSRASFLPHRSPDALISYWDATHDWSVSQTSVEEDTEHVVVWRVDGSLSVDFQVDGAPAGSVSMSGGMPAFDRYVVGASEPNTVSRFDGQVAELLFYDRALLACEADPIVADLGGRYGISVSVTSAPCDPPTAPSGLVASAVDYRQIDLTWADGSDNEDGFRIERREGQTGSWTQVAEVAMNTTSYSDVPLLAETEYCYRVSAYNADGTSGPTGVECATTPPVPPGACFDTGNHDDLGGLWNIAQIGADLSETWRATQVPGCEMTAWYFGLDSGVDSDHPDLNVAEVRSFVASEPGHSGEDEHGHGTHTAGTAAAMDGNGGVVGVAPGALVYGFRVCSNDGQCTVADIVAGIDEVAARKQANPGQPMVANMSLGGDLSDAIDEAVRRSVNEGIVFAVAAGNGILGACLFPANAANVSPARVGDDDINDTNGSNGDDLRVNGAMTVTSSTSSDGDAGCNYGHPVTIAAPGVDILSANLHGGYATLSGTSMATPHVAGAAILYLQSYPNASPSQVEAAILDALSAWSSPRQPTALGRLNVPNF